jgi:DNA recombination protein RmuC
MSEIIGFSMLAILLAVLILQILLLRRTAGPTGPLAALATNLVSAIERVERAVREELTRSRAETADQGQKARMELDTRLQGMQELLVRTLSQLGQAQHHELQGVAGRLDSLTQSYQERFEKLRESVENRLQLLQAENAQKLEQMRQTVDEKLHAALEQRLGESFRLVSDRLEQVHKGLGEMQALATGVGDLKRVLSNVKARGMWGEIQLAALLEQILPPEQFDRNVETKAGSGQRVEYAVRLPGRDEDHTQVVWLPIDAKFPLEDYQRLVDAADRADADGIDAAGRQIEQRIRACARDIHDKYLSPPQTTDFAIMFLPCEGLYAEVLRRTGLVENLLRDHRVVVAGPTTLAALLNSLQVGFRTLAIQRRASEVWELLAAIKAEFGRFGEALSRVQKKLQEASSAAEAASTRTRAIERKLRQVEILPTGQSQPQLGPEPQETPDDQP